MYEVVLKSLEGHIAADSKEANDLRTIRRDLHGGPCRFGQGNAQAHLTGSACARQHGRLLMTFIASCLDGYSLWSFSVPVQLGYGDA